MRRRLIGSHALLALALLAGAAALPSVAHADKLRSARNTYHPVVDVLAPKQVRATDAQLAHMKTLPIEALWSALQDLGYKSSHVTGLKSTRPGEVLVGRALTIRYLPKRPDLEEAMKTLAAEGDWPSGYHVRAGEEAKPGDVVVVDLGGEISDGVFFGDVSALAAKTAGANGVLLYGATRDLTELRQMEGFPVLALGFDPRPAFQIGVDWNVPIRVLGATVLPGDVVVADDEAAVFFPASIAAEVIKRCDETVERENYERSLVRKKADKFRNIYPLSPALKKQFEADRKKPR